MQGILPFIADLEIPGIHRLFLAVMADAGGQGDD
jgi:hypothetical protein